MTLKSLRSELDKMSDSSKAKILQGFFKTGSGDYGEGDIFLGISVPESRNIAVKYNNLSFKEIISLLQSKIHEERLIGLLILVHNYEKNSGKREEIFNFYLSNSHAINNWDLVDLSAYQIVGRHIFNQGKSNLSLGGLLFKLADSENIWERRIAIISTYYFIKNNRFDETLEIAEMLLKDKHDLIHKAVGWMLREVGKRDKEALVKFLKRDYKSMPRTMLRYAIEKFPEKERKAYLKGEIK
ncbi:DNA alkylation repair protein [Candidatus Pacearchaeota archaeon]|nr:DNA alkylation repair protein [Candidatus Pacearchaeota archaeon]